MASDNRATGDGTARYARRFLDSTEPPDAGHFRPALGLTLSSIGAGTYLGDVSDAVDGRYQEALAEAVRGGCNVLDTAINYRAQRSELALGRAVADLIASGEFQRDELVVASKGGFIAYRLERPADPVDYIYRQFVVAGVMEPGDLAGGIHCMAPAYLSQQITWSLRNLGLRALDIYYLHNPETQLAFIDRATFRNRLLLAFSRLEEETAAGRIGRYGVATWEGLRRPPMSAGYISLEMLAQLAEEVGGPNHHFRVVQMPLSAAMPQCAVFRNQAVKGKLLSALDAAGELGMTVIASASVMQGQLSGRIDKLLGEAFPQLARGVLRALQFTRSLPGVTAALVGMSNLEHVRENLALAALAPAPQAAQRLAHALAR